MIVSFSVSNFRSFSSEETFSLVASNRVAGSHGDHAVPIPDSDEKVLRTAVLYGANGAGKSNLFKALQFLKSAALNTRPRHSGTARTPFRFGGDSNEPTTFDLQFVVGVGLYRYGLKLDDETIREEWLLRVGPRREKPVYERVTNADGKVVIELGDVASEKLSALATVGGPQNQSFLASIRANLDSPDIGAEVRAILGWFEDGLTLIEPGAQFSMLGHWFIENPDYLQFAGAFLKERSTGIDHLKAAKTEVREDEVRQLLAEGINPQILANIPPTDEKVLYKLAEGVELLIERNGGNRYFAIKVEAIHKNSGGSDVAMSLTDESDGTRRLLNLLPSLYRVRNETGVYFVDELDRSLHPILVRNFLEFFVQSCPGTQRQVIVTTHDSNLLDLDLLRRDEIWFAEKDQAGATHLYSLLDFKVRNDLEIRKHYLQGRFGAVPFIGDLNRLLEAEEQSK